MMKSALTVILSRKAPQSCRWQFSSRRFRCYSAEMTLSAATGMSPIHRTQYTGSRSSFRSACFRSMMFSTTSDTTRAATSEVIDDTNDNRHKILSLYRSIRRIHEKSLPTNLRNIGNKYLQSEFRTLKDTRKMTDQNFQNFMIEWEKYRQQLLQSQKETRFGQPLPSDVQLTAEQQEQLRKLHQEVTMTNSYQNADEDNKLG